MNPLSHPIESARRIREAGNDRDDEAQLVRLQRPSTAVVDVSQEIAARRRERDDARRDQALAYVASLTADSFATDDMKATHIDQLVALDVERGHATALIEMQRRRVSGERLLPAETRLIAAETEAATAAVRAEEAREEASAELARLFDAQTKVRETRAWLQRLREMRSAIAADVKDALTPARILRAMRFGPLGEVAAGENLSLFSDSFLNARQNVVFLDIVIPEAEAELAAATAALDALEKIANSDAPKPEKKLRGEPGAPRAAAVA